MKNLIKSWWAKKWFKWTIIVVVVIILGRLIFSGGKTIAYETLAVSRNVVVERIAATGQVKSKQFASLRFKTAGTITRMNVDGGSVVSTGQILASLDTSEFGTKVTQAEAAVTAAEVSLANAEQAVADAKTRGDQTISVLYTGARSEFSTMLNLAEKAHGSFLTFYDSSNRLSASIRDAILISQRITDADSAKPSADVAMAKIKLSLENFPASASRAQIDATLEEVQKPLQSLQESLGKLISAIAAVPTGGIAAATLEDYKTTLSTAQSNINAAISGHVELASDIRDAKIQNTLDLNTASASQRSAEAELVKMNAALSVAQQNLSDAYLRAPIDGTIATKNKQVGESITTTDQVYYLLGADGLEIVANIPEIDIAKVSVGDTAKIGLDAYDDEVTFLGRVAEIDPAETVVDGIATYKVTFAFDEVQVEVRSGMTANISIETDRRENVIAIPQRAVISKDRLKFVRIPGAEGVEPKEIEIKTGLRGGDGTIEVTEGLQEGTLIITGTK